MKVYCAVENNRLERIAFMADSLIELAKMLGVAHSSIRSARTRNITCGGYKIISVDIGKGEDDADL